MPDDSANDKIPPGFKLRHVLRGHNGVINRIAWSPDGRMLASGSEDQTIRLWDTESGALGSTLRDDFGGVRCVAWSPDGQTIATESGPGRNSILLWDLETGNQYRKLEGHSGSILSITWSPDGRNLASGSGDRTILIWDVATGKVMLTAKKHSNTVYCVAWSPDGRMLASGGTRSVRLWYTHTGQQHHRIEAHSQRHIVFDVAWSNDGQILASASGDKTLRLWDPKTGRHKSTLEGHTEGVSCISFSHNNNLLASKSQDGSVRLWRCDRWELVTVLEETSSKAWSRGLAFHPTAPILATLGEEDTVIRIWELDFDFLSTTPITQSVQYTNAKCILLGDSGVGKSGLGLVLSNQPFVPTESTHGRSVWTFDNKQVKLGNQREETRETLLWDFAGQPGYRLVHQLHLNEVAVALVIFDARSETNPFAGVYHWDRALRQAQKVQADSVPPMKKFLVAARTDRGGIGVSRARIDALVRDLKFDGYFETSAKEGWQINELAETIRRAINWDALPKVSSTELFQQIKAFLIAEKEAGRLLSTSDDLYRALLKTSDAPTETDDLHAQFETCIGRVESRGLIRRLSFGDLVLLQPELLDAYASALVNAAKDEPDGLGSIAEENARAGRFRLSADERLKDKALEKLLLIATIEDLLSHEIALREPADDGPHLVFPSQLTRENPDLPDPAGKAVIFTFEGPVLNVYATLAVRLSHSGMFKKKDLWKNAIVYLATFGGICGMFLREFEEGRGELTLFFDDAPSEQTRFQFEQYVEAHLWRRALPESITRRRIFVCPNCGTPVSDLAATRRRERGFDWMACNVCDERISLRDREERLASTVPSVITQMDRAADEQRDRAIAATTLQGKKATGDFDLFLSYSTKDQEWVQDWLIPHLEQHGIYAFDQHHFEIGVARLVNIERAVERCRKTLLVLTPGWVESEWNHFENLLLQTDDPAGLQRRMLPLMLAQCKPPKRISIFTEADFTQPIRWEQSLERLVAAITDKVGLPELR